MPLSAPNAPAARATTALSFDHLIRMTDQFGLFEHADGATPRYAGGYCVDDVARALVVVCRQQPGSAVLDGLAVDYLDFLRRAQHDDGRYHNRRDRHGHWEDRPGVGDWWGRALWGLGTAAARGPRSLRHQAAECFDRSATQRSPHLRAMAFAALGAAEVLGPFRHHGAARRLLADFITLVGPPSANPTWPWPQPRLTYGNATVPDALLAAGAALGDPDVVAHGLSLLDWLLAVETTGGHLSVTPVGGWGPGERRARFDQQPIEAAALADACARAYAWTGDPRWADGLHRSIGWFLGDNDHGADLRDPVTGGGYDALTPDGRNTNQGAESTLAMLATMQLDRSAGSRA